MNNQALDTVAAYVTARAAWQMAYDRIWGEGFAREKQLERDLDAAFKRAYPRKRTWNEELAGALPEVVAIRAAWNAYVLDWRTRRDALLNPLEAAMEAAALAGPLPTTGEMRKQAAVDSGTYHTQGYGAIGYARTDAQMLADKAAYHGLVAEVRPGERRYLTDAYGHGMDHQTFEVWANTDATGWAMLSRRESVPLRESVRLCWKRGVNPRVYWPFLPHGYEEREGLDYFGNDLRHPA